MAVVLAEGVALGVDRWQRTATTAMPASPRGRSAPKELSSSHRPPRAFWEDQLASGVLMLLSGARPPQPQDLEVEARAAERAACQALTSSARGSSPRLQTAPRL